jgi:hypothetical protein
MTPQLQALVGALERARFPYPVAIYPEDVWVDGLREHVPLLNQAVNQRLMEGNGRIGWGILSHRFIIGSLGISGKGLVGLK